jgi:hypothetical protein
MKNKTATQPEIIDAPPAQTQTNVASVGEQMSALIGSMVADASQRAQAAVKELEHDVAQSSGEVIAHVKAELAARPFAVLGGAVLFGMAMSKLVFGRRGERALPTKSTVSR